jgi:integrase/recombinase XerD
MSRIKVITESTNKLSTVYEAFQVYNRNKNLRPATISSYGNRLMVMKTFLRETQGADECNIQEIDSKWLSNYISWSLARGNKPISINDMLKNTKIFLNFALENGYITLLPKFQLMKADTEHKEPYTQVEIAKLLKKPERKYFPFYRTWAAIYFVMGTGCRVGTLVNIKIGDVDFAQQAVRYGHTKNRKFQVVPIPPQLIKILREYLLIRKGTPEEYLFPNHSGKQWTTRGVADALFKYNKARGISKTSVHLLRHTFATQFVKAGGSVVALQKQLGHSSLEMTERYIALSGIDLKDSMSFNPLQTLYNERISM